MQPAAYVRSTTAAPGVIAIEFGTPAHNSLPIRELTALAEAFDRAGDDPACRVVILRSGGERTFCAGASLDELLAIDSQESGEAFFAGFARVLDAMRRCGRPIVGRIQGKAIGGGVGLVAACDVAYATRFAGVRLSELTLGIGAFVIAPAVARKVGTTRLAEWSLCPAEYVPADAAEAQGLYLGVVDDAEALDQVVLAKAVELAGFGVEALTAWREVLWRGTEDWTELLLERAAISGRLVTLPPARQALAQLRA